MKVLGSVNLSSLFAEGFNNKVHTNFKYTQPSIAATPLHG
jgi:hypothetical protein